MTNLIEEAREFATKAHAGQKRKYSDENYIVHPAEVVDILREAGISDEATLAAAWLHDVVEDCDVTIHDIAANFGYAVACIVWDLTDPPTVKGGPNREARKVATRERFSSYNSDRRSHDVKCANILANWKSIADNDPEFAVTFMNEIALLLPCLNRAYPDLQDAVRSAVNEYERRVLDNALEKREIFNGG